MSNLKSAAKRQLGKSDLKCAAVGLGCMSLSGAYGTADDEETVDFGQVRDTPVNKRFVQLSVSERHNCGVDIQGDVHCWGWNEDGQSTVDVDNDGYDILQDCDDSDPSMPNNDMDCDGVLTANDCDDSDPNSIEDMDCDSSELGFFSI